MPPFIGPINGYRGTVVTVPFSAGNFGASGGTWSVSAGDVPTNIYYIMGRFIHYDMDLTGLVNSTVTGTPAFLTYTLPFIVTSDSGGFLIGSPGATPKPGFVSVIAGSNVARLFLLSGNWTPGANTALTFEISLIQ